MNREIKSIITEIEKADNSDLLVKKVNEFAANVHAALGLDLLVSFDEAARIAYDFGRKDIGDVFAMACNKWADLERGPVFF